MSLATPIPPGFCTQEAFPPGLVLSARGEEGSLLGEAVVTENTTVSASETVRDGARYLESNAPDDTLIIVHRTEDIARNLGGDTRKALRQALGALEEDPTQLESLLKLTEKVIFDSDDIVRTTTFHRGPRETDSGQRQPAESQTSLALDAAGRRSSCRKRSLASGDIVVLLDALMRRLGEGLPTSTGHRPPNDQDQIGADEEDGGELCREAPDFETLAKACRGKVRRLVKRMEGQLELAADGDNARRAVIQLAAVLGVIRTLRIIGHRPEWRRTQLELVDREDEGQLLVTAVLAVCWGGEDLASRAITEAGGEWFDELSLVAG